MKISFIKVTVIILIVFVLGTFFVGLNKAPIYDTKNLVGNTIDEFKLNSLDGNSEINHLILKENKFTLINFWASWCAPCRAEHKYLVSLYKNAKNLKLLGINFKDEKKNAKKFLNDYGNPFHYLAQDNVGKVSINFGVYGIPESILINNNLKIIKKFVGPLNKSEYESILKITE